MRGEVLALGFIDTEDGKSLFPADLTEVPILQQQTLVFYLVAMPTFFDAEKNLAEAVSCPKTYDAWHTPTQREELYQECLPHDVLTMG